MQAKGWIILDPRLEENYNFNHIAGSVNVPLFRDVQGTGTFDNIKRVAMGLFAMRATGKANNVQRVSVSESFGSPTF